MKRDKRAIFKVTPNSEIIYAVQKKDGSTHICSSMI